METLQRTGSFKIRGAYHRLVELAPSERARGVVAASAGNHAQGVALAARLHRVRATIFMPRSASIAKIHATRRYGAEPPHERSYLLHCERSVGQYLFDALLDAGAEFGVEVDGFTGAVA